MRVLLISANTEKIKMPTLPLGLALVAAATRRAGHATRFLDLLGQQDPGAAVRRAIGEFAPEAIGISVRNIDDQTMEPCRFLLEDVRDVVAVCRAASGAPLVLGGAGYSMFPEAALRYLDADFGVCGEGEAALPSLLGRLEQGQDPAGVPGVYLRGGPPPQRREFVADLDQLPAPGDELWSAAMPGDADVWVPVQTRRGCPLDCTYCSTPHLEGRPLRALAPEEVARMVARIAQAGFRQVYFVDNTFNLPPAYALRLCRCLADLPTKIRWRAILYPHAVPEELIEAMAQAGCVEVSLGFESGSLPVLQAMNKRFGPEEIRHIAQRLGAHGIRRLGFVLLGGPGESEQSVEESLALAESLRLEMLNVSVGVRIYPYTPLARIAVEDGLLDPHDDLLQPRFYLRPELAGFIRQAVAARGLGG